MKVTCEIEGCDNEIQVENEAHFGLGIVFDYGERICRSCSGKGLELEKTELPF